MDLRDFEAKALVRARYGRLAGRPVLAIAECNVATEIGRAWLAENNLTELGLNYTYKSTGYTNHNDAWALRPGRGRDEMRAWVDAVMLTDNCAASRGAIVAHGVLLVADRPEAKLTELTTSAQDGTQA